jgi:tetratricopeptide (TPR) repeat protein
VDALDRRNLRGRKGVTALALFIALALIQAASSCGDDGIGSSSSSGSGASVTPTIPDPFAAADPVHAAAAVKSPKDPTFAVPIPAHVDPATQKLDSGLAPAWRALKASQWKDARDLAEAYVHDKGAHPGQAQFVIGLTFHRQMLYAEAVEHFLRALKSEPGFLETYFHAGYALLNVGRLAEARASLAVYARFEPDEPSVPFGQGLVEIEADSPDAAERYVQRAIDLAQKKRATSKDPRAVDADLGRYFARLGDVYVRRDETARAREAFEKAVSLRDDMPEIWSKVALVRERMGDSAAAAAARAKYEELSRKGAGSSVPR